MAVTTRRVPVRPVPPPAPVDPPAPPPVAVVVEWMVAKPQGQTAEASAVVMVPAETKLGRLFAHDGRMHEYVREDAGRRVYRCNDRP